MNHLNASFDPGNSGNPSNPETWSTGLIAFASVVGFIGLILFIVTIIWFITWIKYSWVQRTNSANLTGGELSQKYLQRYGVNAKRVRLKTKGDGSINQVNVESKFFYLSPYIVHENSLTLRLLPWTYHRSSIYSLAMAMENTWAVSSSKSTRFNSFWWDFARKISLLLVLIPLIFAAIFALAPYFNWSGFVGVNSNVMAIILSVLGAVFLIGFSISQLVFYSKSRKEITENLKGFLQPKEIKAISWIFQIKFIYYLIRMIYEVLRFILQILILIEGEKK
ncbi:MAG: hypothetical protein REH79_03370 [Spiroplasma sp.]|nr:hypothetical protein [Spiroplasma sp.]